MNVVPVPIGAVGTDSLQAVSAVQAQALKARGSSFCIRYLGSINADELAGILDAGLGFMPVTFGDAFDGNLAVARCKALGLPAGTTVWLDMEGQKAWNTPPAQLIASVNGWCSPIKAAGYMPGLYVGAPQPLTSDELYGLATVRYWHGQGRCVDRNNALAEPKCGWCMIQAYPSVTWSGVSVDADFAWQDYEGRVPFMVIA